jgi:hypothetical protein
MPFLAATGPKVFGMVRMKSLIFFSLSLEERVVPVAMMSMLISPVVGSVADYYMAFLISLTASSRSLFSTNSDKRILARDSEILIIDSSYLGVAVMVFLLFPRLLMLRYS